MQACFVKPSISFSTLQMCVLSHNVLTSVHDWILIVYQLLLHNSHEKQKA
jgi:hypothetical protein